MLTKEQQRLAEEASRWVPRCVAAFLNNMPCLREAARLCDLESAAYLAVCKAARTYNPDRGAAPTYFGIAIKNAMLREIQNEMKTGSTSIFRISPEECERRMPVRKTAEESAIACLLAMTAEEREWIESFVFDGASFRALGRQAGCDARTAKRRLLAHIEKLRKACDDSP